MSFLYGLVDLLLTTLITLDTLGLVKQFREKKSADTEDYTRVCFTWIFFLTLSSFTPSACADEGFLRKLLRVLFLAGKIFVTIPIVKGTMMIYNTAPQIISKGVEFAKNKMGAAPVAGFRTNSPTETQSSSMPSSNPIEPPSTTSPSPVPNTSISEVPDDDK